MRFPIRTELEILPADKPNQSVGWTCYETVGVAAVNPRGVTRMGVTSFFYLFESHGFNVYYDEIELAYYLAEEPMTAPITAEGAKRYADYILRSDGKVLKSRDGCGEIIWTLFKDEFEVHQIMVS